MGVEGGGVGVGVGIDGVRGVDIGVDVGAGRFAQEAKQ